MRDFPSVPNVFRVASSHSVNTDDVVYNNKKHSNDGQQIQIQKQKAQQHQNQQLKQNGIASGQKASSLANTPITTVTKTSDASQTGVTTTAEQTTASSFGPVTQSQSTVLKSSAAQTVDTKSITQIGTNRQQHRLTTHASIERPQYMQQSQIYLQSPYATLPRNPNASQSSLSLHNFNVDTDFNLENLAPPTPQSHNQYNHHKSMQTNSNRTSNQPSTGNITATTVMSGVTTISNATSSGHNGKQSAADHRVNNVNTNENTMMGVINTISGSIPATGFSLDQHQHKNNQLQQHAYMNGRNVSKFRESNANMNLSYTNLSKLNGIQLHHQQQQQQQSNQQNPQKTALNAQQHNLRQTTADSITPHAAAMLEELTTYRRRTPIHPYSALERNNNNGYLWIITPVAASISVAIVIAALAGPQWLFTEEKMPNANYNGTANFNVMDDGAYITRYTKSSLWIICSTTQGMETYSCIKIDYFSKDGYQPDPHDSSSAIPYTVTKSCPIFLAAGIMLLLSFIIFLIPTCSHQNNLYYFSAGIMFIVSGLLMLIGLIAYISVLKAEIGSKLRPRSSLQPPMFKVTYGQSFFLFVFGFIATEFVGLLNIFLYISLQEVGYYSEKIREGQNPYHKYPKNTYKSYKHEIEKKPVTDRQKQLQQGRRKHQVRAQELELDSKKLLQRERNLAAAKSRIDVINMLDVNIETQFACSKHPNGMGSSLFLNELDRRYYFDKSSNGPNNCNLHSKHLAKSLNELYLESSLPPPPPSSVRVDAGGVNLPSGYLQLQRSHLSTLPRPPHQFSDSPTVEFPLTRSVSTTTDIYATQNSSYPGNLEEKDTTNTNNRRRNVATSTRNNTIQTDSKINLGFDYEVLRKSEPGDEKLRLHAKTIPMKQQENKYNKWQSLQPSQQQNDYRSKIVGGRERKADANEDINDDNDVDEEQPQKLCGLKRSIRKTKDELFEEFCKRAGVRPKPKNIYFIENEDDNDDVSIEIPTNMTMKNSTQKLKNNINSITASKQHLEQLNKRASLTSHSPKTVHEQFHEMIGIGNKHSRGNLENERIYRDAIDVVNMDDRDGIDSSNIDHEVDIMLQGEDDEHGLKKLAEDEDHLYVIDDNIHLMPQSAIRNARRASMYVEPNHLRRLNSNLSLHALYAPRSAIQKSLYDLDVTNNEYAFPQASFAAAPQYMTRDVYGGSQNRLQHDFNPQSIYQSRTLPRSVLRRKADSQDSIASAGVVASSTQLNNVYSTSQQRLTALMLQQQQQQQLLHQQQNRYLTLSRDHELYGSQYGIHKSNEELNRHYIQQPIYIQQPPPHLMQYQQQQHPQQRTSMANSLQQPSVQWPVAIPSSPSNFSESYRLYNPNPNPSPNPNPIVSVSTHNSNHPLLQRSLSGGGVGLNTSAGPAKFQRAYAFDEQRRPSAIMGDAFDLDEMERERRRSHISLYAGTMGINGSPAVKANAPAGSGGGLTIGNNTKANNSRDHYDMINGTAV